MKIWRRSVGVAPIKFEAFVATALGVPHMPQRRQRRCNKNIPYIRRWNKGEYY